ncbi:coenzyme Q biosynthesis protein Coq4-domain-containing protein [Tuber brumale]|nr:coenzyme Q biosynthesis protein Coq4-domain-containing protein [Tuber brumale]
MLRPAIRRIGLLGDLPKVASTSQFVPFTSLSRPPPNYEGHVPLTIPERGLLAVGSAVMSLLNPRRADLIAALGEATATPYFIYRLRDAMLSSPTGRRILKDRPRINSTTMSMEELRKLPDGTVGKEYVAWLDKEGVSPDTRPQVYCIPRANAPRISKCIFARLATFGPTKARRPLVRRSRVRYIDDPECAYVIQRYRECHDFYHALTGLPIMVEGEVALKAFEFANTLIPMTGLSMFAVARLKPEERRRVLTTYFPWAIRNGLQAKEVINIYWEEELETDVEELRKRIGLEKPPDLRKIRAESRARRNAEKVARESAQH